MDVDGWMGMGGWMNGWMDGGGWMEGWVDGWVDGGMGGWMDGWGEREIGWLTSTTPLPNPLTKG